MCDGIFGARNIRYFKGTSVNNRFADITPLSLRCICGLHTWLGELST